jgi:pyridoxal phosphate enzyme (YggS family)
MQVVEEPALTPELIRDRYDRLLERLRAAAAEASHDPTGVRVVAVTKGFGTAVVRAALAAGLSSLGENRVQEAADKVAAAPEADWHMIGHLQANKARAALRLFRTIHSIDSIELLGRIDRIAHDDGRRPRLLLQVNIGEEPDRSGFDLAWFDGQVDEPGGPLVEALATARSVEVAGVMGMASYGSGDAASQFATLRGLRDRLRVASGMELPELSMGMTADAEVAVREGATLVRIGTAIFGPRPKDRRE